MINVKIYKDNATNKYLLSSNCITCKRNIVVTVEPMELFNLQRGVLIQNALPNVNEDQREFLISGICGKCFDKMFVEPDDED